MKKIKVSSLVLMIWYLFWLIMLFKAPASGCIILLTALCEWLWRGPLKRHGLTWTIKK